MLKPITFTVELESGPLEVTAGGPDYIAYEERFANSANIAILSVMYTAWVFVCWHAMQRQGLTEMSYEDFVATTPELHREAKVEEIVPLEEATTSTGPLSPSPTTST